MTAIDTLSAVALLEDLPEHGLVRGQVGTVVENWAPGVYEVEFCNAGGKTYAKAALKADHVIVLRRQPMRRTA